MKIGTAAGGSLDSDDVLLARGGFSTPELGEINEWVAVQENATISSVGVISDGQFDLPLRRASVVPQGFLFNATDRGDEGVATTTWGYSWDTGEFTDLGSILPDWELASTMVRNGITVFAGRETPADDWDLFRTTSDEGTVPLAVGPGNQQYPAFTPDGSQVVFADDGDLAVIDIDGSNEHLLVDRGSNAYESSVSPDGIQVAFASDHAGNDDIWVVDLDGGEPVNITQHPADEAWPVWSTDGSRIYFQSDRLRPENEVSSLMMMNPDGSDQSWFSGASLGQAVVLDPALVGDALDELPSVDELYFYQLIEGEPGTTTPWEHSSGRLSVDPPAGWRVGEFDETIGFVAGPRPVRYFDAWEADSVAVSLFDDHSNEDFFALFDETAAAQSCERIDGSDGQAPDDGIDVKIAHYACGDEGAVAGVVALYDNSTGVGVILEGQHAADSGNDLLTSITGSLDWG